MDSRSDYGYALYVGVMPQGGATLEQAASVKHYLREPPGDGEALKHYTFTCRRRELLSFEAAEAGMTAYFCARYENRKGWQGGWGPISQIVIPKGSGNACVPPPPPGGGGRPHSPAAGLTRPPPAARRRRAARAAGVAR